MSDISKTRLDQILVERFGYESRSRAKDAILRKCVRLDGKLLTKPSQMLASDVRLEIDDEAGRYVSRAALKLLHALKISDLAISGKIAVDLGASTGGFTQVLLELGAARVYAVDVGHDQIHPSLRDDKRVEVLENLNVRDLDTNHLDGIRPELIVCDLSFISLKTALPPALNLAKPGAFGIFLIKPQFEVGRENIGSGGIVRNEALIEKTVEDICNWMNRQTDWMVTQTCVSPITGGDGNTEFLMIAKNEALA